MIEIEFTELMGSLGTFAITNPTTSPEASGKFNDLLHGECVGLGMLYMVSDDIKELIKKFLIKYNLPYECSIDKEEF